jgi:hypothetical protein
VSQYLRPIVPIMMPNSNHVAPKDRPRIELLDEAVVEVLRRKTPAERVAMVFDAERTMGLLLAAHLRWRHPDWDAAEVAREIARRRNREPS